MQTDRRSIISLWFYAFLATLVGLLLAAPFFMTEFPLAAPEAAKELALYQAFAGLLDSGTYLPRWLPQAQNGAGSPVFFFEAPLGFYATWALSRLARLSPAFDPSWSFSLGFAVALLLSTLSCYYWLVRLAGPRVAFLAAFIYAIAPGHLSVAVLEQGSLGDAWAYVWLPLVLRTIDSAARGSRGAVLLSALTWALLILSNPVLAASFIPVALAYAIVAPRYAGRERSSLKQSLVTLVYTGAGLLFGTGLAGFYLAPAIESGSHVAMTLPAYALQFRNEYLFADLFGPALRNRYLDAALLSGIAFALCFYFSLTEESERETRRFVFFWTLASFYVAFLMTEAADPLWTALGELPLLQHPGDTAALLALSLAALAPAASAARKGDYGTLKRFLLGLFAALILASWIIAPLKLYQNAQQQPTAQKDALIKEAQRLEFPEYLPRYAINTGALEISSPDELLLAPADAAIEIQRISPRKIDFRAAMPAAGSIVLQQLYYPHWAASIPELEQRLRLNPVAGGVVEVSVPEGLNTISIELLRTPGESAGNAISAVSFALVLMLAILSVLYPAVPTEEEFEDRIDDEIDAHLEEPIDAQRGRG